MCRSAYPESITGTDKFEHLTLEPIRGLIDEIKPDMVQTFSEAWDHIGKGLNDFTQNLLRDCPLLPIGARWQGDAAPSVVQAISNLTNASIAIGRRVIMTGMRVAFAQRRSGGAYRMLSPILAAAAPEGRPIQLHGQPPPGPA